MKCGSINSGKAGIDVAGKIDGRLRDLAIYSFVYNTFVTSSDRDDKIVTQAHLSMMETAGVIPAPVHTSTTVRPRNTPDRDCEGGAGGGSG